MAGKTLQELEKEYDLQLEKIIKEIKNTNSKKVLLQFPDGFKPYATIIADYIEKNTDAIIIIWLGSCFGACDLPKSNADLIIQFGHSPWK